MAHDIDLLTRWIQTCLVIAAVGTTSFPLLYSFSRWYASELGRLLMFQGVVFALAIDLTLLFQFWTPTNPVVIYWVNGVVFTLISLATSSLTLMLWRLNHPHRKRFK